MIAVVTAACLAAPNTAQIMERWNISFDKVGKAGGLPLLSWRWGLDARGLAFTAALIIVLLVAGEQATPVLYYQF
jgi:hypothetical protein